MLKIAIQETTAHLTLKLDGRLAGLWVAELERVWEAEILHQGRRLDVLDIRDLTFANTEGALLLKRIYKETKAAILASTPWTRALSDEIREVLRDADAMEDQHAV